MAIEILDHGACKAAGTYHFTDAEPTPLLDAQGILSATSQAVDNLTVELKLSEQIGADEFVAFGVTSCGNPATCGFEWVDVETIRLLLTSGGIHTSADFIFFKIQGMTTVPYEPVIRPILDVISPQPLWMHALGLILRSGQTTIGVVEREDAAQLDLATFVVDGVVDIPALVAWGGAGDVTLVSVSNAVDASPYPSISAASAGERAKVVVAGVAVIGENGYLAAAFDGVDDGYQRADSLGLIGDPALTAGGDLNGAASYILRLGDVAGGSTHMFGIFPYPDDGNLEVDVSQNGGTGWILLGVPTPSPTKWHEVAKALNCGNTSILTYPSESDNVAADTELDGLSATLDLTDVGFEWSSSVSDGPGNKSEAFVFNAQLDATNAALLRSWQARIHA